MSSLSVFACTRFSEHALSRMRQRQFSMSKVESALRFGTEYSIGQGRIAYVHPEMPGGKSERDSRATGSGRMAVLVDETGLVLTVHRVKDLPHHWRRLR